MITILRTSGQRGEPPQVDGHQVERFPDTIVIPTRNIDQLIRHGQDMTPLDKISWENSMIYIHAFVQTPRFEICMLDCLKLRV